jgi:hypothetical protein
MPAATNKTPSIGRIVLVNIEEPAMGERKALSGTYPGIVVGPGEGIKLHDQVAVPTTRVRVFGENYVEGITSMPHAEDAAKLKSTLWWSWPPRE